MNCAECRDNLVAFVERLLDAEQARQCRAHLETCAACRAECASVTRLQQRLAASGQVAAEVSLVEPVMRRVRPQQLAPERKTLMNMFLKNRWGFGLGAAGAMAALVLMFVLTSSRAQATAVQILAKGAKAVARLSTIHFRGQLRTYPADNFSLITPEQDFVTVELWKQLGPELKWRIEKPGRVAVMDGQSTLLFIKTGNQAYKIPKPSPSAFDTQWLHEMADLGETLEHELSAIKAHGWPVSLTGQTGPDGNKKSVITVEAKSGLPDSDYVKNKFFMTADTRRVYVFDNETELLESVRIYVHSATGDTLVFDLNQIEYNQPIAPQVWELELPKNVNWYQEPQRLPDNEKYASMTADQAARAFFEACAREDWAEVGKFMSPVSERLKESLGGLQIIQLGESFTSQAYGGRFVPYEIGMRVRDFNVRLSNANAAKRYVITGTFDSKLQVQEEQKWATEPEVLPENDAYAAMSPAAAAKAAFDASAKLDWAEMRKFFPAAEVEKFRREVEGAEKQGIDVRGQLPAVEVGEAFWSAEHSAWFVKCRSLRVRKHNLALRKDNPVGRWQVDGGI